MDRLHLTGKCVYFEIFVIYNDLQVINSRIHERNHQILLEMHHRDQLQGMHAFQRDLCAGHCSHVRVCVLQSLTHMITVHSPTIQ